MDWDRFYLQMARLTAGKSKDPSTKCGCVIVRPDRTVVSVGFNGFPRGMKDDAELYADREIKYSRVLHAEENAILNARNSVGGCTVYVNAPPCNHCALVIIQSGITAVVCSTPTDDLLSSWGDSIEKTKSFFHEVGISYQEIDDVG